MHACCTHRNPHVCSPRPPPSIYRGHPRGGFPLYSAVTRAHDMLDGFNSTQADQQYEQELNHNRKDNKKNNEKEHQKERELDHNKKG